MKHQQFEDILIHFSKSLMGKENEEDIFLDLAKNCVSKLSFMDCVVYVIDDEKKLLLKKAAHTHKKLNTKTLFDPIELAIGKGIVGHVAKTGKAELIQDTSKESRYIENNILEGSEICVPIICDAILYGIIDCRHTEKGFFKGRHLKLLSAIASICAIKIKSVRDNKELISKQAKLISIKEEMLELKLRALSSHLNPHFVFNSLNAIQYFITTQNTKSALDYFSTFSRLVRFYLNQLGKDSAPLYNEIDMLHWYLKLQKLRYDDSFDYTISIKKENNESKEAIIPSYIISMLFENIVEQSNMNNVTNQHFNIILKVLKDMVKIEVQYQCKGLEANILKNHEYRRDIVKWKDQVELLNAVKGYDISHETSSSFNNGLHEKNIVLNLPNLA